MVIRRPQLAFVSLFLLPFAIVIPNRDGTFLFFLATLLAVMSCASILDKKHESPMDLRWLLILLPWPVWVIVNALFSGTFQHVLDIGKNLRSLSYLAPLLALLLLFSVPKHASRATIALPIATCLAGIIALVQKVYFGQERAFGGTHPILFADITLILICLSWVTRSYWNVTAQTRHSLITLTTLFGGIAIITSGSRGCWLALPVIGFLLLHYRLRDNRKQMAVAMGTMLILIPMLYFIPQVQQRVNTGIEQASNYFNGSDYNSSVAARFTVWELSIYEMIPSSPITGTGYQGFKSKLHTLAVSGKAHRKFTWISHAHNEILHVLTEQGIIGLSAFLIMYIGSYRMLIGNAQKSKDTQRLKLAVRLLFAGFIVYGLTDTMTGNLITHTFFCSMIAWLSLIIDQTKRFQRLNP
ncbi:O-antigen ligase family protein [Corallincola spongiicola]|uniref:O-antigen ligase family protein n=1 Tax=Corallincola spongiicola TaxID=2520508 RepID=A0ABY1WRT0_9GAMM|nr:O-antigen ligase family protein [Corallincola spongiicola]TAA47330.1 O-antigen ligase family protein [Corallincola spongiicola]